MFWSLDFLKWSIMLINGYGQKVNYLGVSIAERCNFRCQYCMPKKPFCVGSVRYFTNFSRAFKTGFLSNGGDDVLYR